MHTGMTFGTIVDQAEAFLAIYAEALDEQTRRDLHEVARRVAATGVSPEFLTSAWTQEVEAQRPAPATAEERERIQRYRIGLALTIRDTAQHRA